MELELNVNEGPQGWMGGCVSCEKSLTVVFTAVFREFRFTSEVPIWLDYHGKHVVIEQVRDHSHNKSCSKPCNEAVMNK